MTQPLRRARAIRASRKDGVTIADLRDQFEHNMRVRDLVSDVNRAVLASRDAHARLRDATGAAADTLARSRARGKARHAADPLQHAGAAGAHHVPVRHDQPGRPEDRPRREGAVRRSAPRARRHRVAAEPAAWSGPSSGRSLSRSESALPNEQRRPAHRRANRTLRMRPL